MLFTCLTKEIPSIFLRLKVNFSGNIYEARRQLMGLKELAVIANIPATYTGLTQVTVPPNSSNSCERLFIVFNITFLQVHENAL